MWRCTDVTTSEFIKRNWLILTLGGWASIAVATTLPWHLERAITTLKILLI